MTTLYEVAIGRKAVTQSLTASPFASYEDSILGRWKLRELALQVSVSIMPPYILDTQRQPERGKRLPSAV